MLRVAAMDSESSPDGKFVSSLEKQTRVKYKFAWGKTWWEVKPDELQDIGGVSYIRLSKAGLNFGFPRLCFEEKITGIPKELREREKEFNMAKSIGYTALTEARN